MKAFAVILALLVGTMVIVPAYAVIVDLKAEKTSYKKGDQIVFIGKTDAAHANNRVAIRIADPNNDGIMLREAYSDSDGNFKTSPIDTSAEKTAAKFTTKGVYNATAFYSLDPQPQKIWKFTLFDYSSDGSPVSPSAAQIMAQQSQPATPSAPTTSTTPATSTSTTTPTQPTAPTTPTQPTTPTTEPEEETMMTACGTGTVFDEASQTCIVASAVEPEPEPIAEPEEETTGPKKTHIPGFPDPTKDPQYYIDRYNNEPKYKEWFDKNFPDDTIYDIVGVDAPTPASACGPGTHSENGVCVLDKKEGLGSGCLIATAAHGSELAPQVQQLRELRDGVLSQTNSGIVFLSGFNEFYYTFSPAVSDLERQSPIFKEIVKATLSPMLSTLSILNYVDIDSEQEMLGYGIGIILLNAGMYFVAPVLVIIKLRKHVKL
ncbi:MAG: CFI-box-CTERM domain-containing protein [Candidatus Nitrosotenuis sp.]